jgi:microsomal epoxide hydrolase
MRRLGHGERWAAQGGDWGGEVTVAIGARRPAGCLGIHLSSIGWDPDATRVATADADERGLLERRARFARDLSGYDREQSTRPQTLGYGLADSPASQAAWIYEKFHDWTDNAGQPEDVFTLDEMLDNCSPAT